MMETTTIEIDFDIHKMIEGERRSFSEKPYIALRRLLNLPEIEEKDQTTRVSSSGRAWEEDGVTIPHGSLARMEYARGTQKYEGQFLDGHLVVNGVEYTSLSAAASALAKTKNGGSPNLNGWNYWEVQLPGSDRWEMMEHKRRKAKGKAIF
ncbi:hypothetical protein [Tsuneonella mangrovi]|uniref:hypothetical protein n=1 Tax=Tsuneonella mangrovi TaxID=1982042 RepID=UPI000BA24706|nr:hypothetical protein [Tsuneonella mangrovi]